MATLNVEEVVLHYADSNLRKLCIDAYGPISNKFFNRIAGKCSRLDYLLMHPSKVTASPVRVVRMFERMSNIESLDLEKGLEGMISSEMLRVIAAFPVLDQVVLPNVQADLLHAIQSDPNTNHFPKLRYLYVGATSESLRLHHRVAAQIEALGSTNEGLQRTNDVLTAASRFRQLTSFTAQLSTSSAFHGEELILLAQGCQALEELEIGIDVWYEIKPSATGITNELIGKLAPCLRNLKCLSCCLKRPLVICPDAFIPFEPLGSIAIDWKTWCFPADPIGR